MWKYYRTHGKFEEAPVFLEFSTETHNVVDVKNCESFKRIWIISSAIFIE